MFSFKLPISITKELEKIYTKFVWNGRMNCWSWDDICTPNEEGGIGLRPCKFSRCQACSEATHIKFIMGIMDER